MLERVFRNLSVRIGASVIALMMLVAIAAPWLGTVDPSLFDAGSRDLLPGKSGEITTLEGENLKHTFLMGSDSYGRDIYSRVIYGTRVSLVVGIAVLADFRIGAVLLIMLLPMGATHFLPHGLMGVPGLNPVNVLVLATLVLIWWLITIIFQGEGLELDLQRRRHPMWEWLFSHPVRPGAVFLAEMLSPIAANPIYVTAPLFFAVLYSFAYDQAIGLAAMILIGVPVAIDVRACDALREAAD